ncbi:MAG: hypothetical protein EOP34_09905 [Rickettsiales bacterium]|nr:MAG: hypothetical protein EOP34_09905 [Rickettsiales bacterium]
MATNTLFNNEINTISLPIYNKKIKEIKERNCSYDEQNIVVEKNKPFNYVLENKKIPEPGIVIASTTTNCFRCEIIVKSTVEISIVSTKNKNTKKNKLLMIVRKFSLKG